MTRITQEIADQATDWLMRQDDMAAADWLRFVGWLESDPRHAEAFDRLTLADGALATAPELATPVLPLPANDRGSPSRRRLLWLGGGLAGAAAAAAVTLLALRPAPVDMQVAETRPGETRQIMLDEGSRVELAGGSRLLIDRAHPRQVVIERGEALFHVRHDAADPFVLRSGALTVRDVGTVFNVARDGAAFRVEVAEGAVLFQPGREAIALRAGASLSVREDLKEVRLGSVDPSLVGGWRSGRLSFSQTPVPEVLRTIQRLYGIQLVADERLSSRTVTGMISLSGEAHTDVPHIASLVGANWRTDGERWILSSVEEAQP
ncbi:MAG: FecR domain-containing protein [Sphingomonas sp.]|nr:FecR domain-containing protein [Sphingomonas sp.]